MYCTFTILRLFDLECTCKQTWRFFDLSIYLLLMVEIKRCVADVPTLHSTLSFIDYLSPVIDYEVKSPATNEQLDLGFSTADAMDAPLTLGFAAGAPILHMHLYRNTHKITIILFSFNDSSNELKFNRNCDTVFYACLIHRICQKITVGCCICNEYILMPCRNDASIYSSLSSPGYRHRG